MTNNEFYWFYTELIKYMHVCMYLNKYTILIQVKRVYVNSFKFILSFVLFWRFLPTETFRFISLIGQKLCHVHWRRVHFKWGPTCTQRDTCPIGCLSLWHWNILLYKPAVSLILSQLTLWGKGQQKANELQLRPIDVIALSLFFIPRSWNMSSLIFPSLIHRCDHLFMDLAKQPTENSHQPSS